MWELTDFATLGADILEGVGYAKAGILTVVVTLAAFQLVPRLIKRFAK